MAVSGLPPHHPVKPLPRTPARCAIAVLTLMLLGACARQDPAAAALAAVRTTRVATHDIVDTVEIAGEVVPVVLTEIKSEISGRVVRVHAQPGERVKLGQVLVELDQTQLDSELHEAERLVEAAEITSAQMLREFRRQENLHTATVSTDKDLLDAQVNRDLAMNNLEVLRARLGATKERLAKAVIRAPHDGVVLQHTLRAGQVIVGATSFSQGTILMQVADLTQLLVETKVNEIDSPRVQPGMKARISFDTIHDLEFPGVIETVAPSATVVDLVRVFLVRIRFDGTDARIKPGISANVSLPVEEVRGVPAVPLAAIFMDGPRRFVYRKQNAEFFRVPVAIGVNDLDWVEIRSGLKPNDEIALVRPAASRD
jgi:HlyD family secretion protein